MATTTTSGSSGSGSDSSSDSGTSSGSTLRIVTWNLLCPGLCDSDEFPRAKSQAHLDPAARLLAVRARLAEEMKRGSVICLQELSPDWYAALLVDMSRQQLRRSPRSPPPYTMVSTLEDHPGNLFGAAVCFPSDKYELVECTIRRVGALLRVQPWPSRQSANVGDAAARPNRMVAVKLRPRRDDRRHGEEGEGYTFVVATYHMPCAFRNTTVMALHAAAVVRCVRAFAADAPAVLAGDFNCVPGDPVETLLRTGSLPPRVLSRILSENGGAIVPEDVSLGEAGGLESAFSGAACLPNGGGGGGAHHRGCYTVCADTRRNGVFVGVLDYIWLLDPSRIFPVSSAPSPRHAIYRRGDPACEFMPNGAEPSDHLMLAADLDIVGTSSSSSSSNKPKEHSLYFHNM